MNIASLIFTPKFLATIIRMTTPLIYAMLAAVIVNRSGVMNLAVESTMLTGALLGVLFSTWTKSAWLGFFLAVLGCVLLSLAIGYAAFFLKADESLNGVAFNLMMQGGTIFALYLVTGSKGMSNDLQSKVLPKWDVPILKDIPFFGTVFSGHYILTYIAVIMVIFVHILIFRTKFGLRLRLVGENPQAAESVGINPQKMKMIAMCLAGGISAIGGCFMSMGYVSWFQAGMTAGRGFIGMASATLGANTPLGGSIASMLFGTADAISITLSTLSIPSEFVSMIPYVVTVIGLVISSSMAGKAGKKKENKK